MSKNRAQTDACPFSSTSFHSALRPFSIPMWLGTVSSTRPMPCRCSSSASAAKSSSVPTSGFNLPWLMTSYPWRLSGAASSSGEAYTALIPRRDR